MVEYMRTYERLYGLRVLSYCIMSNHSHILVEVPQRPADADLPGDADTLVAKVRECLGDKLANGLEWVQNCLTLCHTRRTHPRPDESDRRS